MNVDKIIEKIIDDAKAQSEQILQQSQQKAQTQAEIIAKETDAQILKIKQKNEADVQEVFRKNTLVADLEIRKNTLAARRSVIEKTYETALSMLEKLDEKTWQKLMLKIVDEHCQTGFEKICVSKNQLKNANQQFFENANEIMKQKKLPQKITLDDQNFIKTSGMLIVSEKTEINASFAAMVSQERKRSENEVAKMLFPPQNQKTEV